MKERDSERERERRWEIVSEKLQEKGRIRKGNVGREKEKEREREREREIESDKMRNSQS